MSLDETIKRANLGAIAAETLRDVERFGGRRPYDAMVEILYRGHRLPAYLTGARWEVVIDHYSYSAFPMQQGESPVVTQSRLVAWANERPELFKHWK